MDGEKCEIKIGDVWGVSNSHCGQPTNRKSAGSKATITSVNEMFHRVYYDYLHGPHSDTPDEVESWNCDIDDFLEVFERIERE